MDGLLPSVPGEVCPNGMQRLLRTADWDVGGVRDDVRDYVVEHLGPERAGHLIAEMAVSSWQRLSVGAGAHGPREYDWIRKPVDGTWARGRGHWLLARRSITPNSKGELEIAYYLCYGPKRSRLVDLAWVAGSRWHIEEAFQQAKNEAGLDHCQVRAYRAWYAHITLSMLALAWLAAARVEAAEGEPVQTTKA